MSALSIFSVNTAEIRSCWGWHLHAAHCRDGQDSGRPSGKRNKLQDPTLLWMTDEI